MSKSWLALAALLLVAIGCGGTGIPAPIPTPHITPLAPGVTAYGFFPSPPEVTLESVLNHYTDMARHADVVLLQHNIPWQAFPLQGEGEPEPQPLLDIRNQVTLAHRNGLEPIFVVNPLNGLNRREFMGLPEGWPASFENPDVRQAYGQFTAWIVRTFHPRYLGLASEINTYADAHPEEFARFLSLYRETYASVKQESPETRVFVTFQWEDLNNLFAAAAEGRPAFQINWEQIEAFEPQLDLWVISSYPFAAFGGGDEIPDDYYTPLLARTDRPLAVAEGGYTSSPVGPFVGTPQDQVDYLQALQAQLGPRLRFWIYLLLTDFNTESYAEVMRRNGVGQQDVDTLGLFSSVGLQTQDGSPRPALAVWDALRADRAAP